jgi:hypothetical protein
MADPFLDLSQGGVMFRIAYDHRIASHRSPRGGSCDGHRQVVP